MTTATPGRRVSPAAGSGRPGRLRPIFVDVARSEWVKLRTVRSTYWTLVVMAVSMVGFGALLTVAYLRHYASSGPAARAAFDPAAYSLSGFFPAQLAIAVLGAGLYLAVLGLLAVGLGALIRRTAGAIAAVVGLVLILPVLVQGLPAPWRAATARYLPSAAGQAIIGRTKFTPPGHLLSPWTGFTVFCAYAAAVLIASVVCLNRRDV